MQQQNKDTSRAVPIGEVEIKGKSRVLGTPPASLAVFVKLKNGSELQADYSDLVGLVGSLRPQLALFASGCNLPMMIRLDDVYAFSVHPKE